MKYLTENWIIKLLTLMSLFLLVNNAQAKVTESEIQKYCDYYNYKDCALVKAIIWHESMFRASAKNEELTGSYGLMQIQCSTARMMGLKYGCEQLYNPQINIRFGIKYLQYLEARPNITSKAELIAAYNAGSPIVCNNINYNENGKLLCYPGEFINNDYVYGKRGVMRRYGYNLWREHQKRNIYVRSELQN